MPNDLNSKLRAMFWDLPEERRIELAKEIQSSPYESLCNEQNLIRALNSLAWYDLLALVDRNELVSLLTDDVLMNLFPAQRRLFYKNARRLLSKYAISASGQSA